MQGKKSDWNGLPPSKSLFHSREGCGLPIGNLTSQLFSNIYMNEFDQYMKRVLHCHHYGRYVDDAYVVSTDMKWLRSIVPQIRGFLNTQLHIELHGKKLAIDNAYNGTQFLGSYIKPWRTYVATKSAQRIKQKFAAMDQVSIAKPSLLQSRCNSYSGLLCHYKGLNERRYLLCQSHVIFKYGYWGRFLKKFSFNNKAKLDQLVLLRERVETYCCNPKPRILPKVSN